MGPPIRPAVTPRDLVQALSMDCELHAKAALEKLHEVIDRFQANDPLAAIGAFEGITEIVFYMDAIMKRLAAIARQHGQGQES